MNKVLITGGTGLVGSMVKGDIKLGSKDADLRDFNQVKAIFEKYKPTKVVHLAARVGGVGGNIKAKGEFYFDNIMINTNILEACRIYNVEKTLSFLSTCIFPDNVEYPLT